MRPCVPFHRQSGRIEPAVAVGRNNHQSAVFTKTMLYRFEFLHFKWISVQKTVNLLSKLRKKIITNTDNWCQLLNAIGVSLTDSKANVPFCGLTPLTSLSSYQTLMYGCMSASSTEMRFSGSMTSIF